jgi:hypothetical protein
MEVFKMSEKIQEDIQRLSELIRKVNDLINPEDSLAYLQKKDLVDRLYGKHPKCFIKLTPIGRDTSPYLIPLCNRSGYEDPKVIAVAIKMVEKLMTQNSDLYDSNDMQKVLNQLNHRNNVLSKVIPKPAMMAAQKSKVTRMFNNIRQHLDVIKGRNI